MTKCYGCGIQLQNIDSSKDGYTKDNKLCERCFRIKNYNDYKVTKSDNNKYLEIINDIAKTDDLVLVVVDIFNITNELNNLLKLIPNDKILVLTKKDLINDVYEEKLLNYFNNIFVDKIIISSKNNYGLDFLISKINKYKKSKNVYIVGFTNAGKSTLINKIIYNYTDNKLNITTSNFPSTTLDINPIKINEDFILIDTPGILDEGNIVNYIDKKYLKKIIPTRPIKPIVYQVKFKQTFIIDDLLRIDVDSSDIVFYISNSLKIQRIYKNTCKLQDLQRHEFLVSSKTDVVIAGLGFIKVMKQTNIVIYTLKGVKVYVRNSLI